MTLLARPPAATSRAGRTGRRWPLLAVAALAVVLRLAMMAVSGGWHSAAEYDDGVHYAASVLLLHGQLPYADQTFLQPPGISVLLLPFAAVARLVGDEWGLALARVATCLVGGVVSYRLAALVAAGRPLWRGAAAGLVYATAASAVLAGSTVMLEPWLSLLIVTGWGSLLPAGGKQTPQQQASTSPDRSAGAVGSRALLLSGVALGGSAMVKTWGAVAVAAAACWLLLDRRRRQALSLIAVAAGTALAVLAPFLLVAPSATVRDVVGAQLRRPPSGTAGLWSRLSDMTGATALLPSQPVARTLLTLVTAGGVALLAVRCWSDHVGRLAILTLIGGLAIFTFAGPYYTHYGEFVALPAAAIVGIGLPPPRQRAPSFRGRLGVVAGLLAFAAVQLVGVASRAVPAPVDVTALDRALPPRGCVIADQPVLLELADRLDTDRRCPQWLDARGTALTLSSRPLPRHFYPAGFQQLPAWQAEWRRRWKTADALILTGAPCRHTEWTQQTCHDVEQHFTYTVSVGYAGPARTPIQVWTGHPSPSVRSTAPSS